MAGHRKNPAGLGARHDRLVQEARHDTYKMKGKLPEPTACPQCGAVYHKGRWTWTAAPRDAHKSLCPACHRINDKYPGGLLTLKGPYLAEHKEELLNLARNEEKAERDEHPLSRIMSVDEKKGAIEISTTDAHLPQRIGEALHHAHQGTLTIHYAKEQKFIRVTWAR